MWQRLNKFDEIEPGLYISSVYGCESAENIDAYKVSHILSMGAEFEPKFADKVEYLKIAPLEDSPTENILQYLDQIVAFIDKSITAGGNVACHCRRSISKAGAAAIAYLIWKKGMSFDDAFAAVKSKRGDVNPNPGFVEQVKQWEQENKGKGQ
eukprot:Mrub_11962.p2 GENE.Mrub_11962~~Mrub_11962.p2  ORF type:complete len:153 (-),score=48.07 Mrub_11962:81-539(-)